MRGSPINSHGVILKHTDNRTAYTVVIFT